MCYRWPGSAHDSTIFNNSALCERFEQDEFGSETIILGDSAYPPANYICKPLANPMTYAEKKYQKSQIKTRNVVERTFGGLKRMFPILAFGMQCKLPKVQDVIVTCCILYNMAKDSGNAYENDPIKNDELQFQADIANRIRTARQGNQQLSTTRFLIDHYFSNI